MVYPNEIDVAVHARVDVWYYGNRAYADINLCGHKTSTNNPLLFSTLEITRATTSCSITGLCYRNQSCVHLLYEKLPALDQENFQALLWFIHRLDGCQHLM